MILAALALASLPADQPIPEPPPKVVEDKSRQCVHTWRAINYAMNAADVATTIYAIEKRGAVESNPLVKAIFGSKPKLHEALAVKAVSMGLVEIPIRSMIRAGNYRGACQGYRLGAIVTGGVVGLNLRFLFR